MYQDLDHDSVIAYIKEKTALFPHNAILSVYEIGDGEEDGDGFINFLYRVWDQNTGKSVIVKQAKTYYQAFGEGEGPFVVERNTLEAQILRIREGITPEYIPRVYHVDPENHLFICEDCGDLKILRFELMKGKQFPKFPAMIGEYIAKSNFYTSEVYLKPEVHQNLQAYFINTGMRQIFQTGLFLKDESCFENRDPHNNPDADAVRVAMGDLPWKSRAFRTEMLKLRHIHMKKSECLVHGDLHTSNIMIGSGAMKIIDMEYTYMGPLSADSGYLMGSLIYEYIRWFYMPDHPADFCAEMRAAVLSYMKDFIDTYAAVYRECWEKDARITYRGMTEYCDGILETYFHEMTGFAGCQMVSRVGGVVPLPDFDTLTTLADQHEASRIAILIGEYLIMHREAITDSDALVRTVVKITATGRALFGTAKK